MQLSCYWFDKKRIHSTRNCFQILFFMAHLCLKNSFHKKTQFTIVWKGCVSHSKSYYFKLYVEKTYYLLFF